MTDQASGAGRAGAGGFAGPANTYQNPNFLESLLFLLGDPSPEGKVPPAGGLPEFLYQAAEPNPGERPLGFLPGKTDMEGNFLGPALPGFAREGLQQLAHLLYGSANPGAYVTPDGRLAESFPAAGLLSILPFGAAAPRNSLGSVGGRMRVGHASSLEEALQDAEKISKKNERGAWTWETPEDYTTNLGRKPKQGKLLGRMIGDEWFPIEQ